ncbi:hypothetical protein ACU4GD_15920 [Cupriavidus basilensis]
MKLAGYAQAEDIAVLGEQRFSAVVLSLRHSEDGQTSPAPQQAKLVLDFVLCAGVGALVPVLTIEACGQFRGLYAERQRLRSPERVRLPGRLDALACAPVQVEQTHRAVPRQPVSAEGIPRDREWRLPEPWSWRFLGSSKVRSARGTTGSGQHPRRAGRLAETRL